MKENPLLQKDLLKPSSTGTNLGTKLFGRGFSN